MSECAEKIASTTTSSSEVFVVGPGVDELASTVGLLQVAVAERVAALWSVSGPSPTHRVTRALPVVNVHFNGICQLPILSDHNGDLYLLAASNLLDFVVAGSRYLTEVHDVRRSPLVRV
jgi:hypothetical protein